MSPVLRFYGSIMIRPGIDVLLSFQSVSSRRHRCLVAHRIPNSCGTRRHTNRWTSHWKELGPTRHPCFLVFVTPFGFAASFTGRLPPPARFLAVEAFFASLGATAFFGWDLCVDFPFTGSAFFELFFLLSP